MNQVQISHFNQHIKVICSTCHGCKSLETTQHALPDLVILGWDKLAYELLASSKLFEKTLHVFVSW